MIRGVLAYNIEKFWIVLPCEGAELFSWRPHFSCFNNNKQEKIKPII